MSLIVSALMAPSAQLVAKDNSRIDAIGKKIAQFKRQIKCALTKQGCSAKEAAEIRKTALTILALLGTGAVIGYAVRSRGPIRMQIKRKMKVPLVYKSYQF